VGRSPLRLCFVSVNAGRILLGHSTGFGGAETEMINLLRELACRDDLQVTLVTVTNEFTAQRFIEGILVVPVAPTPDSIKQSSFLVRRRMVLSYYARFFSALLSTGAHLYFSKLASDEAVLTFLAARLRSKPFCFRVEHDWECDPATMQANLFRGNTRRTRAFAACLRRADLVICQTEKQRRLLRENYGQDAVIINNAHPIPPLPAKHRGMALWAARAHPMKRPQLFAALARELPDLSFCLVMPPDTEQPALYDLVKNEAEKIPNLGFVRGLLPKDLADVYGNAWVFVLTSEAEGFSNTVIESWKAGTPVVSFSLNFDGLFTNLQPGNVSSVAPAPGFCTDGDMAIMKQIVERLCTDKNFWHECSQAAYQRAREDFDVERIGPKYVELMQQLVRR